MILSAHSNGSANCPHLGSHMRRADAWLGSYSYAKGEHSDLAEGNNQRSLF